MLDPKKANLVLKLEATLKQQLSLHGELLELLQRKREVLRTSDNNALTGVCVLEHEKMQKIAELEKQRLKLVAQLTLMVEPGAREPLRMAQLADKLGEPVRGRMLVARHQLLEKMKQVQAETNIVRRATEAMANHLQGVVQTLGALSAGVATYGRRGALPQKNAAVSTFSATA